MPLDRDELGKVVRDAWVNFAKLDPNSPPHHLTPWEDLDEKNKEADRRIGEAVAMHIVHAIRPRGPVMDRQEVPGNTEYRGGCQGHA